MGARWRVAILLAVITTINFVDRSVFGLVAPVTRGEFGVNDAVFLNCPLNSPRPTEWRSRGAFAVWSGVWVGACSDCWQVL